MSNIGICHTGETLNKHQDFSTFLERFKNAITKVVFHGNNSIKSTPVSIINASKYILEFENGKVVFVLTPYLLFEELCDSLWKVAKAQESRKEEPIVLLERLYNTSDFQRLFPDWGALYWSTDFDSFCEYLKEESFFYFDDLENQYYFNLFRFISKSEFVGGILHALTNHNLNFSKFHPESNDNSKYQYNSFMSSIIKCCVFGSAEKKDSSERNPGDFNLRKSLPFMDKRLNVVLYFNYSTSLYYLKTFFISR